jgi:hypothetical protein
VNFIVHNEFPWLIILISLAGEGCQGTLLTWLFWIDKQTVYIGRCRCQGNKFTGCCKLPMQEIVPLLFQAAK